MLGKDSYFYLYLQRFKNEQGDTKFHSQIILLDQAPIQSILLNSYRLGNCTSQLLIYDKS
jgi:hypothetical protein